MQYSIHSKQYEALRQWLIQQRHDLLGLNQRDLAEILGVHRSVVAKIESGDRKLDIFDFIEYCQAIGADPHDGLSIAMKTIKSKRKK